jgi:hypothetical protein
VKFFVYPIDLLGDGFALFYQPYISVVSRAIHEQNQPIDILRS